MFTTILQHQISRSPKCAPIPVEKASADTSILKFKSGKLRIVPGDRHLERLKIISPYFEYVAKSIPEKNLEILLNVEDHAAGFNVSSYPVLCYGKSPSQNYITIPNPDFFDGVIKYFFAQVKLHDVAKAEKIDKSIFIGNSTGNGDRITYCENMLKYPEHDAYMHLMVDHYAGQEEKYSHIITDQFIPVSEQLKYKFLVTIDGHGRDSSRLAWHMASNSVPVYINRSEKVMHLHHYLVKPGEHFIDSTIEEWPSKFEYLTTTKEGQELCKEVIQNGKDFCAKYLFTSTESLLNILEFILRNVK